MPRWTTIRVDPEVWARLVERQTRLTLESGRQASMNEAVKNLLRETAPVEPPGASRGLEGGRTMMAVRDDEKIEVLEEVLQEMDEIAQKLRHLGNARIRAYCLANFEGREGGWLGEFVRDILEQELETYRNGDEEVDEE